MNATEIKNTVAEYSTAIGGDRNAALWAAVADLLVVHGEAELRQAALDQWVSRGYVRGRARDILATALGSVSLQLRPREKGNRPDIGQGCSP